YSDGLGIRREEARQTLAFVDHRGPVARREPRERRNPQHRFGPRSREPPGPGGEAIDEDDGLDDRVLRVDRRPVPRSDHAVPVLVADKELVVAWRKAHRRPGVAVGPR